MPQTPPGPRTLPTTGWPAVGLTSAALTQPLLEVLAKFPGFLTAHRVSGIGLVAIALVVGVVLPLAAGLAASVACRLARQRPSGVASDLLRTVVPAAAGVLLALVSTAGRLPTAATLVVATASGIAVMVLLSRRGADNGRGNDPKRGSGRVSEVPGLPHRFFALLSLGLLVFPLNFLASGSIRPLWLDQGEVDLATLDLEPSSTPPIVMVVFDELPTASLLAADGLTIDGERFPGFHRLAASSTWYRRATAVAPSTFESVPALLTGYPPIQDAGPTTANYPENLFTLLAASDYDVFAIENLTRLCPDSVCTSRRAHQPLAQRVRNLTDDLSVVYLHQVAPRRWQSALPDITNSWRDFRPRPDPTGENDRAPRRGIDADPERAPIPALVDLFIEQLPAEGPSAKPDPPATLRYLHLNLPHVPYQYLPDGRQYGPVGLPVVPHGFLDDLWQGTEWEVTQAYQRHLLQTQFSDHVLSRILDRLEASGRLDETLLIVVADHGASFLPGEARRAPTLNNMSDIYEVPLFVKFPGQTEEAVEDRPASLYDVMPTLFGVLGTEGPPTAQQIGSSHEQRFGHSLTGPVMAAPLPVWYLQSLADKSDRTPSQIDASQRQRSLDERHRLIPPTQDLFSLDLPPDLRGTDVNVLIDLRGTTPSVSYQLRSPEQWQHLDPSSTVAPAHVVGTLQHLEGNREPGTGKLDGLPEQLAIVVQGRLAALTRPYLSRAGVPSFSALFSPDLLTGSSANVEVFAVDRDQKSEQIRLRPLEHQDAAPPEIIGHVVPLAIQLPGEGRVAVVPSAMSGSFEMSNALVDGWARLSRHEFAAYEELLLFDDADSPRFLYRGIGERQPRPIRGNDSWTGFKITLPATGPALDTPRVFARRVGAFSELHSPNHNNPPGWFSLASLVLDRSARPNVLAGPHDRLPVRRRGIKGNISRVEISGRGERETLRITGWAAQTANRLPVAGLAINSGGKAVAGRWRPVSSPVIQQQFGTGLTDTYSFAIEIRNPGSLPAPDRIRIFALAASGIGVELQSDGRRLRHLLQEVFPADSR